MKDKKEKFLYNLTVRRKEKDSDLKGKEFLWKMCYFCAECVIFVMLLKAKILEHPPFL